MNSQKDNTYTSLRKLNSIAGLFHLFQAFAVLIVSKSFSLPISGSYLTLDKSSNVLVPESKILFSLSLPLLIAIFFFLSAFFHFYIATIGTKSYRQQLSTGMNKVRWYEYSLSASVMMVAISLLVGIYDLVSLVLIFSLTAVMNLMGLVMEVHNQTTKKTSWLSFNIGTFAGLIPWLAVASYLWLGAHYGSKAPTFVYYIFVSIFLFFMCFAVNMLLQYKKIGKWNNYLYGEKTYIMLSLIAKSLLAWQVFAGTLRP